MKSNLLEIQNNINLINIDSKWNKLEIQNNISQFEIIPDLSKSKLNYSCPKCDIQKTEESKLDLQIQINENNKFIGEVNSLILDNKNILMIDSINPKQILNITKSKDFILEKYETVPINEVSRKIIKTDKITLSDYQENKLDFLNV